MYSLLLILFCSFSVHAQLQIVHDTVWYPNFPADNLAHGLTDTVLNVGSNSSTMTWYRGNVQLASGWTCSFVDDIMGSYGCADTSVHSVVIHPNQPGVFRVNMKASPSASNGPCIAKIETNLGAMTFVFTLGTTSVNNTSLESDFILFPQPFQDRLKIEGKNHFIAQWELTNVFGQTLCMEKNLHRLSTEINTAQLAPGIYFLKIKDQKNQVLIQKLLKN
jgi:hypothetical protein